MRAIRTHCMRLIIHLRQQHLTALNTVHLHFSLLPILEVERRETFELVFLCHGSGRGSESGAVAGSSEEGAIEEVEPGEKVDAGIRDGKERGHEIEGMGRS